MPVVYVHGNAGSFRTVRSLAVTQNLFSEYQHHFNYYTVDLNEEYAVLSGRLIQAQSDFLSISIDAVLQRSPAWSSVVLVSHSIGTTVALNLLADPDFNQSKVSHVISLAGPLQRPLISPGPALDRIYERVHNVLAHFLEQPPDLDRHSGAGRGSRPVLLSLTGGSRDVLVHDNLGDLGLGSAPLPAGFLWFTTTSIAHVWATCDHKAILWCRQLMIVLTAVMEKLKLVSSSNEPTGADPSYSSLTQSLHQLLSTRPSQLTRHIVSPLMTLTRRAPVTMSSLALGRWDFLTDTRRRYLHADESHSDQYLYVKIGPFFDNPMDRLLLLAGGVNYQDHWLYWCLVDGEMEQKSADRCTHVVPVLPEDATTSSSLVVLPHPTSTNTAFQVACLLVLDPVVTSFRPGYLLVVRPRLAKLTLTLEVIEDFEGRVTTLSNQSASIPWWPFKAQVKLHNTVDIRPPHLSTIYHRILLPANRFFLQQSLPALRLIIQAQRCNQHAEKDGLLTFFTPWNDYFYHHSIPSSPGESVTVALDVPSQPPRRLWSPLEDDDDGEGWEDRSAIIDFYLNPGCEYTISVQRSLFQWIAKLFLLHGTHLLGFISSHVLLSVMLFAAQRWWSSRTIASVHISRDQISYPSQKRTPTKRGEEEEDHPCSAQDWCFSPGYHVLAGLFHFLIFQFINLPTSDWQRMQLTGEVGLRWSDTQLLGLSSLDRLVAMAPLGLLLLPVSLLIAPVGVRLGLSLVDLVIRWSVHLVHNLTGFSSLDESGSKSEQQRLDVLVPLFIFGLSLTCSEALGVLLSAGHIFWRLGRTASGIRRSRPVEVHHLAGLTVLMLSAQLLESWHTLVSGVWQIANNRGLTLEQLWLHVPQLEWPIILGLIAVALSDWLISSPARKGHHHWHHHWLLQSPYLSLAISITSAVLCFLFWTLSFHTALHLSSLFCTSAWCLLTCLFALHLIPDLSPSVVVVGAGGHSDWSLGKAKKL